MVLAFCSLALLDLCSQISVNKDRNDFIIVNNWAGGNLEPIVTAEDFLKTYKNGLEMFEKYREAMELVDRDITLQRIIDKLEINRKTLYKWRKENAKPDSLRGLEMVQRRDWVPLTCSSKNFPRINRIAAWALSGGSIHHSSYRLVLSGDPDDLEKIEKDVEELGLNPKVRKSEGNRGPNLGIEGRGASRLGRVIHCLGVPKGEKAQKKYDLPDYIEKAPKWAVKDFLEIYLSNRMILLEGRRGMVLTMERYGEYKKAGKKFYRQLNDLMKRTAGAEGNIYPAESYVGLYYDREKTTKILNSLEIRYNQKKRQRIKQKLTITRKKI